MCCAWTRLATMTSLIDPEDGPEGGTVVSALNAVIPPPNPATAGPAVCVAVWLTYKNVMGSLLAMGGQGLFPTCWVIPVSCVNNAHIKAIWATHNLKRRKGPKFLLITYTCSLLISLVTSLSAGGSFIFFSLWILDLNSFLESCNTNKWLESGVAAEIPSFASSVDLSGFYYLVKDVSKRVGWNEGDREERVCVSERERETYTP